MSLSSFYALPPEVNSDIDIVMNWVKHLSNNSVQSVISSTLYLSAWGVLRVEDGWCLRLWTDMRSVNLSALVRWQVEGIALLATWVEHELLNYWGKFPSYILRRFVCEELCSACSSKNYSSIPCTTGFLRTPCHIAYVCNTSTDTSCSVEFLDTSTEFLFGDSMQALSLDTPFQTQQFLNAFYYAQQAWEGEYKWGYSCSSTMTHSDTTRLR